MSGKMGSGASHILEGLKPHNVNVAKLETDEYAQVNVKREEDLLDASHKLDTDNVNMPKLETDEKINLNVLRDAMTTTLNKKQRISIWAPDIALVMWYLKLSTPMFSISDVAKKYIAEGLERDHPELFRRVKRELSE